LLLGSGRVLSAIFGLGMDLENFPLKRQIFQFLALQVKQNFIGLGRKVPGSEPGRPLIYCRSKVCLGQVGSGRVRAHLLLKGVGQKGHEAYFKGNTNINFVKAK